MLKVVTGALFPFYFWFLEKAREAKTKKLLSRFKADKERHKKESEEDAKGSAPGRLLPKMTSFKKFFH